MAYAPTKYSTATQNDIDLAFKAPRLTQSTKYDDAVWCFQSEYRDLGGPPVKTGAGVVKPIIIDGKLGPQTVNALLRYQEAAGLPRTGKLDVATMNDADWRVYGLDGKSWSHFKTKLSQTGAGGRAYVSVGGYAYNMYVCDRTGKLILPVNANGLAREGQRKTDVNEATVRRSLGYEGAVNRPPVGGDPDELSWHALALAGDDMADQDKDRIIDPDELILMNNLRNYNFLRAQALGSGPQDYEYREILVIHNGVMSRKNVSNRGLDREVNIVVGNKRLPDGRWMEPALAHNKDISWNAVRNTWKGSTRTVHVAPFHLHENVAPGAPFGSPF